MAIKPSFNMRPNERSSLEEWQITDERLLRMVANVQAAYAKPLWFGYNPALAESQHGSQGEYADCLSISFSVEGHNRDYVIAHELAHALRNSRSGSLQLVRALAGAGGRNVASAIASILEHPSVITIVRHYEFVVGPVFEERANEILNNRRNDHDFMSGEGNLSDWIDLATLVEFCGAYKGPWSDEFVALYETARPRLLPIAEHLSRVIEGYTVERVTPVAAATKCAELMGVPWIGEHFTERNEEWLASLGPRPAE